MLKRPLPTQLPTPEELARVFKKPTPSPPDQPKSILLYPSEEIAVKNEIDGSIRHAVPPTMMPVLFPPYVSHDFFTDLQTYSDEEDLQRKAQISQILHTFPPPPQPVQVGGQTAAEGGIPVPFIFPPVPPLRPDLHLNDTALRSDKRLEIQSQDTALMPYAPQINDKKLGMENQKIWSVIPPLPFPPPNYMPYPLVAQKAPLTPGEIFEVWIKALENLPRVDMVVASAAGSIIDIRSQSEALGFDVEKLDRWMKERQQESDPEADEGRSETDLEGEIEDFTKQIDTTNVFDEFAKDDKNLLPINSDRRHEYLKIALKKQEKTTLGSEDLLRTDEWSDGDLGKDASNEMPHPQFNKYNKEVVNASGTSKERRRLELLDSYNNVESYLAENREQLYAARKRQLLDRLRLLQESKLTFDDSSLKVKDDELESYIHYRRIERDHELLRLKIYHNHEKLKAAQLFYQSSNSTYRGLNRLVINKLRKLKNFLEHQQLVFAGINGPGSEIYNLRSKESASLTNFFVEQDYSNEVKKVFRTATYNEDNGLPATASLSDVNVTNFNKVFTNREHTPLVHDFMPLATEEEFRLVTGDAPSKLTVKDQALKGKVSRHQIFQSPLYERLTSESDSNASDSTASTTKRRPGRRAAPKPMLGEEPNKERSEAALVAKIMKQFVGPAAANADELTEDLELMNVNTRWPVR